ncbi:MAG: hypothetical protein FVQ85_21920 [Planctomycetes bacterium]|nr:hypothetical protein [Planctomycetota bacterium]
MNTCKDDIYSTDCQSILSVVPGEVDTFLSWRRGSAFAVILYGRSSKERFTPGEWQRGHSIGSTSYTWVISLVQVQQLSFSEVLKVLFGHTQKKPIRLIDKGIIVDTSEQKLYPI